MKFYIKAKYNATYLILFWEIWNIALFAYYHIVPWKRPFPSKGPAPNFDSSVVCEVLRVKFLQGDSKV